MRVLVFHQFYTRLSEAGISRFNLFAPYWQRDGVEMTMVGGSVNYMTGERKSGPPFHLFWREVDERGVFVIRAWSSSMGFGYRSFLGRICSYVTFLFSGFFAGMFAPKPDLVIVSSPPLFVGIIARWIAFLRRAFFVVELRSLWPDELIELRYLKQPLIIALGRGLERWLYRGARFIITTSLGFRSFLVSYKQIPFERIGVVPNPIDPTLAAVSGASYRTRMGWHDRVVVLYAGSLSFVYDFDTLLDVAKELRSDPRFIFVIAGDGRRKSEVRDRIATEGIHNVKLMDSLPKQAVAELVAASDICVATLGSMRLLQFVYATKVFDYMAGARPIVLAMEGVTAELVSDIARAGIALPPGDRALFCEALLRLARDPLLRQSLGDAGRRFAFEHLTAEVLAREYVRYLAALKKYR